MFCRLLVWFLKIGFSTSRMQYPNRDPSAIQGGSLVSILFFKLK